MASPTVAWAQYGSRIISDKRSLFIRAKISSSELSFSEFSGLSSHVQKDTRSLVLESPRRHDLTKRRSVEVSSSVRYAVQEFSYSGDARDTFESSRDSNSVHMVENDASSMDRERQQSNSEAQSSNSVLDRSPNDLKTRVTSGNSHDYVDLPDELRGKTLPRHVAIIMDGNSRWAKMRKLPSERGHEMGIRSLILVVELASKWGVQALTVFAFSTENWLRPKMEVDFLMRLFEQVLKQNMAELHKNNVCIHFIGNLTQLPLPLQHLIQHISELTAGNAGLKLTIALSYSGRQDLVNSCRRLAAQVAEGSLRWDDISEAALGRELETGWMGQLASPDLLIRTSGEQRLSNFLLWQMAYSEIHFCPEYWPDFDERCFKDALVAFQKRERRFGTRQDSSALQ